MRPSGHSECQLHRGRRKQKPQPQQRAMGHSDSILAKVLIK